MIDRPISLVTQPLVPIKPINLRDQVYDQIRQAILERRLKPGDHIREQAVTEMLKVSRTPVREALGLVERDGLVQYLPNRGWFVTKFTPPEIGEIFVVRSGLENLAADLMIDHLTERNYAELEAQIENLGQAIKRNDLTRMRELDFEFHKRLVELANNKRLLQMWQNIVIQCSIVFNYHTVTMPDYDHWQGVRDHTAILNALRSGDPAAVHAINNEINRRVAGQCIEGFLALENPQER